MPNIKAEITVGNTIHLSPNFNLLKNEIIIRTINIGWITVRIGSEILIS